MKIQILDNTHPKDAKLKDYQFHGGLYTLVAAKKGHLKPRARGTRKRSRSTPHVKVELNGTVIMEANFDEINNSKPKHLGPKHRKGHIAFCRHCDIVSFKNIKIKELAASGKKDEAKEKAAAQ